MKRLLRFLVAVIFLMMIGCVTQSRHEKTTKTLIATKDAPAAIGPYSQGVLAGNTLYCSGQIGIDPAAGEMVTGGVQAETRQALKNLGAVLQAAGMNYSDVVRATVFMRNMDDYGKINEIYQQFFKENPPARAAVQVAGLPKDVGVKISLIAVKTEQGK